MIDYVVTEQGRELFFRALQECTRARISWFHLWSSRPEAQAARARLDLPEASDCSTDTARLLGVYAVVEGLQRAAAGQQDVDKVTRLLEQAGLLTNEFVDPAAALLNLHSEDLWGIFASAR